MVSSPSGSHILPDGQSKGPVVKIVFHKVTTVSVKSKLQKPFLTWRSLTLQLPIFFNSHPCACVMQASLYYPHSIYIIYNREGNIYKIFSLVVFVSDGPLPLRCHRIYCIQFYSQPLNTNVLLRDGLSCLCPVFLLLPNVIGSSWEFSLNNTYALQLSADAVLLTSLTFASTCMSWWLVRPF